MKTNHLLLLSTMMVAGCGLEPAPVPFEPPGVDGIWRATSWTVTDKLSQPRMVSDGMGGMVEVPRQFELIGLGGTETLSIRLDGTYSLNRVFPAFPDLTGLEVGTFILSGNMITFVDAQGVGGGTEVIAQTGNELTLDQANAGWDFDQDGTITPGIEDATIAKVFRRS